MKTKTASFKRIRDITLTVTLVVAVTVAGVAIGAYAISPVITSENTSETAVRVAKQSAAFVLKAVNQPEAPYVAGALLLGITALTSVRSVKRRKMQRVVVAKRAPSSQARTPRDIQALAAAGTAPVEIALRTRMPVDAVSMLMRIGQAG